MKDMDRRSVVVALGFATAAAAMLSCGFAIAQTSKTDNEASGNKLETLNLKNFGRPTNIENKWLPMKRGTRLIHEGTTVEEDGKTVPHRVETTITDLVKPITGVPTVVVYELDYSDGELVEAELAFYAQDNDGNVWQFGQYPEEYEDGKFIKATPWIHGFESAHAGIEMQGAPRLGTPSYSQGWGPAVDWTDRGMVHQMGQTISVPAGTYEDVLVIQETAQSEPDAYQLKYYAPGVGNVRVGWAGTGEKTKEVLELTKIEQLTPKARAEVSAKALKLETSAYKRSKNVYAHTAPAATPRGVTATRP